MNELIFFGHIATLIVATLLAHRIGKAPLMGLIFLQVALANLFVTKQIPLFGLEVTTADAYIVGSLLCLNLYSEMTSKKEAMKLANANMFLLAFFVLMAIFQLIYQPSVHDFSQKSYEMILSPTPRIFLASIFCYYISQRIDLALFTRFRKKLSLTKSMICSLSISQAIDTTLFSLIGLYGIVHSITTIIIFSYFLKMITLVSLSSLTLLIKKSTPNEVRTDS